MTTLPPSLRSILANPKSWRAISYSILQQLLKHDSSAGFQHPVHMYDFGDNGESVYRYYSEISKPIDLRNIIANIPRYPSFQHFREDLDLLYDNCFKFNRPGDPIHTAALSLRELSTQLLSHHEDDIRKSHEKEIIESTCSKQWTFPRIESTPIPSNLQEEVRRRRETKTGNKKRVRLIKAEIKENLDSISDTRSDTKVKIKIDLPGIKNEENIDIISLSSGGIIKSKIDSNKMEWTKTLRRLLNTLISMELSGTRVVSCIAEVASTAKQNLNGVCTFDTVKKNLSHGYYRDPYAAIKDINVIFDLCISSLGDMMNARGTSRDLIGDLNPMILDDLSNESNEGGINDVHHSMHPEEIQKVMGMCHQTRKTFQLLWRKVESLVIDDYKKHCASLSHDAEMDKVKDLIGEIPISGESSPLELLDNNSILLHLSEEEGTDIEQKRPEISKEIDIFRKDGDSISILSNSEFQDTETEKMDLMDILMKHYRRHPSPNWARTPMEKGRDYLDQISPLCVPHSNENSASNHRRVKYPVDVKETGDANVIFPRSVDISCINFFY